MPPPIPQSEVPLPEETSLALSEEECSDSEDLQIIRQKKSLTFNEFIVQEGKLSKQEQRELALEKEHLRHERVREARNRTRKTSAQTSKSSNDVPHTRGQPMKFGGEEFANVPKGNSSPSSYPHRHQATVESDAEEGSEPTREAMSIISERGSLPVDLNVHKAVLSDIFRRSHKEDRRSEPPWPMRGQTRSFLGSTIRKVSNAFQKSSTVPAVEVPDIALPEYYMPGPHMAEEDIEDDSGNVRPRHKFEVLEVPAELSVDAAALRSLNISITLAPSAHPNLHEENPEWSQRLIPRSPVSRTLASRTGKKVVLGHTDGTMNNVTRGKHFAVTKKVLRTARDKQLPPDVQEVMDSYGEPIRAIVRRYAAEMNLDGPQEDMFKTPAFLAWVRKNEASICPDGHETIIECHNLINRFTVFHGIENLEQVAPYDYDRVVQDLAQEMSSGGNDADWVRWLNEYHQGHFNLHAMPDTPTLSQEFTYLPAVISPADTNSHLCAEKFKRLLKEEDILEDLVDDFFATLRHFGCKCGTISIFDKDHEIFVVRTGFSDSMFTRESSIAAHALYTNQVLCILDTKTDWRFKYHPGVVDAPHIRFFVAAPMIAKNGKILGVVSLFDREPREEFNEHDCLTMTNRAATLLVKLESCLKKCSKFSSPGSSSSFRRKTHRKVSICGPSAHSARESLAPPVPVNDNTFYPELLPRRLRIEKVRQYPTPPPTASSDSLPDEWLATTDVLDKSAGDHAVEDSHEYVPQGSSSSIINSYDRSNVGNAISGSFTPDMVRGSIFGSFSRGSHVVNESNYQTPALEIEHINQLRAGANASVPGHYRDMSDSYTNTVASSNWVSVRSSDSSEGLWPYADMLSPSRKCASSARSGTSSRSPVRAKAVSLQSAILRRTALSCRSGISFRSSASDRVPFSYEDMLTPTAAAVPLVSEAGAQDAGASEHGSAHRRAGLTNVMLTHQLGMSMEEYNTCPLFEYTVFPERLEEVRSIFDDLCIQLSYQFASVVELSLVNSRPYSSPVVLFGDGTLQDIPGDLLWEALEDPTAVTTLGRTGKFTSGTMMFLFSWDRVLDGEYYATGAVFYGLCRGPVAAPEAVNVLKGQLCETLHQL